MTFDSLYKYRSNYERDISLLKTGKIYAPTVEKLNDPYEGLVEPILLKQLEVLGPYSEKAIESFKAVIEKKNTVGIYSLSTSDSDELLWAHYANSHKGFCIEFDLYYLLDLYVQNGNKLSFANKLSVQYSSKPPVISLQDVLKDDFTNVFTKIIGTKSRKWIYENEVRVLYDKSGEIPIDHRAIKSIIFGIRSESKYIDDCIDTFPYKIDVYKATMTDQYKIVKRHISKTKMENNQPIVRKDFLWVDDSDSEYSKYKKYMEDAVDYVSNEPYIDDIFFVGIDRETRPGKVLIKVNANRNRYFSPWPVKFYYFDIKDKHICIEKVL